MGTGDVPPARSVRLRTWRLLRLATSAARRILAYHPRQRRLPTLALFQTALAVAAGVS